MSEWKLALAGALLILSGCAREAPPPQPAQMTPATVCSLDGMPLMDYPGPKAQIHYAQGTADFFCDTMEMFSLYLKPEQQKRITAVYAQDMGKADWSRPEGHWIDAKSAFYVLGSKRTGSMGPTLASFAREEDAQVFAKRHGGKVLRFGEVTLDMAALDGGALRDERM